MLDKPGYVVVVEAANPMEAQLLAGALESEGIPTHVEGDHLADEFAMSQKMMGLQRVRVLVPEDRLAEAKAVLEELPERAPVKEEDVPWEQADGERGPAPRQRDTAPRPHFAWVVLFAGLAMVFAFLYWQERAINNAGEGADALRSWRRTDGGYEERWVHNGKLHTVTRSASNELAFLVDRYNRNGKLVYKLHDRDTNGMWEEVVFHRPDTGAVIYAEYDEDQDGRVDVRAFPVIEGRWLRLRDDDGDGWMERREVLAEGTNEVLERYEDRGAAGLVRVR